MAVNEPQNAPDAITYNPVYDSYKVGEHPAQGVVYHRLKEPAPDAREVALPPRGKDSWYQHVKADLGGEDFLWGDVGEAMVAIADNLLDQMETLVARIGELEASKADVIAQSNRVFAEQADRIAELARENDNARRDALEEAADWLRSREASRTAQLMLAALIPAAQPQEKP